MKDSSQEVFDFIFKSMLPCKDEYQLEGCLRMAKNRFIEQENNPEKFNQLLGAYKMKMALLEEVPAMPSKT